MLCHCIRPVRTWSWTRFRPVEVRPAGCGTTRRGIYLDLRMSWLLVRRWWLEASTLLRNWCTLRQVFTTLQWEIIQIKIRASGLSVCLSVEYPCRMWVATDQWWQFSVHWHNLVELNKWVASLFIGYVLRWCHLVYACKVKAHLTGCWQYLGAVCFWQPIPSGLNLVVVAVLRDVPAP